MELESTLDEDVVVFCESVPPRTEPLLVGAILGEGFEPNRPVPGGLASMAGVDEVSLVSFCDC